MMLNEYVFLYIFLLSIVTIAIVVVCKMAAANGSANKVTYVYVNKADKIATIKNENMLIDKILTFLAADYCDADYSDREKLQELYNQFVTATEMRTDMEHAWHRDILNHNVNKEKLRRELLSSLISYLRLRYDRNANTIKALEEREGRVVLAYS